MVGGMGVEVEGLGGEADDGEGVEAPPVGSHGDEVVGSPAIGVEGPPDESGLDDPLKGGRRWVGGGR